MEATRGGGVTIIKPELLKEPKDHRIILAPRPIKVTAACPITESNLMWR